ncbi:Transcriptional regulatory protein OmpR [Phycisphaerae bacterium RAS1]|nr:Transcriptional regulatory protein OmpR [Phycisphaerae bacterium RAS1]
MALSSQNPAEATRLLLIDDDLELCALLADYLASEGFELTSTCQPQQAVGQAVSGRFAMVLLDVMLPRTNGFQLLKEIRSHSQVPVLMLTARGEDVDRIVGLELGADDYLPKPFNSRELVARIHAILRRSVKRPAPAAARVVVGDLELDPAARTVRRGGEPVELTGVEFSLLEELLKAAGRVVNREDLFRSVLGRRGEPFDRSLDMHISNLRKKLGHKIGDLERIRTLRGVGYVYAVSGGAA